MSARRLLLVDSDDNFFRVLHEHVSPYGFEIYRVEENPDSLDYVKDLNPQIIFIAVEEPDKVGYSLCNKAKKGVAVNIPVVLTTSSVPPSGFHSHRKLKVHADEYIDKRTMTPEELITKLDSLIGLSSSSMPMEEMSFDDVEEFEMNDGSFEEDKTRVAPPNVLIDLDLDDDATAAVDPFTSDPAFDEDMAASSATPRGAGHSSGVPEPLEDARDAQPPVMASAAPPQTRPSAPRMQAAPPAPASPAPASERSASVNRSGPVSSVSANKSGPTSSASAGKSGPVSAPASTGAVARGSSASRSGPTRAPAGAGLDPGREHVAERAPETAAPDPRVQQRLQELERDNERLKAELDKARQASDAGGAGSSYSREREFLNLREVINKKEREILDLRDEVGAKERQILESKEQVRQLHHTKTALDSKNLELEQRLLEQSEQLEALQAERAGVSSQTQELEAQVRELEARSKDADARATREAERAALDRASAATELERAQGRHAEEVARLGQEHGRALDELRQQHAGELARLSQSSEQQKQALAETVRQEYEAKLAALGKEHEGAMARLQSEHTRALNAVKAELQAAVVLATEEQLQAVTARDNEHFREKEELKASHAEELARLVREHQAALAASESKSRDELAQAAERHAAAEAALRDRFTAEAQELRAAHAAERGELQGERDQLESGLRSARQRVQELEQSLADAQRTLAERDRSLEERVAELKGRDDRIAGLSRDLEELDRHNTRYREQVLKVYRKIKSDEATISKAKKALAIALTLLDENIAADEEASASPGAQPS